MTRNVIIFGSNGALGRAISQRFSNGGWNRVLVDVSPTEQISDKRFFVSLSGITKLADQYSAIQSKLNEVGFPVNGIHAVINAGGGFRMDDASSDDIFENLQAMYSSSVESSMLASHVASKYLAPNGLLVLTGAAACTEGTPWAFTYGSMKSAVHQMVKSLGSKSGCGLPQGSVTVGIAPVMLDTPANRASMPDADVSSWTPLGDVAEELFKWASAESNPESGNIYKIVTSNGKTDFKVL